MRTMFYGRKKAFIPFAVLAFLAAISFAVMSLWNALLPDILHVTAINFWQALGIFVLCKILFGFGKGGRWGGGGAPWMRQRMEERFRNMSPEEREKFRKKMEMCGRGRWNRRGGEHHPFDKFWDDVPETEDKKEA